MKSSLLLLVGISLCAACTVENRTYTGPTIEMQLTNNGYDNVLDSDPEPSLTLGPTDTDYSIAVEILTRAGELSTKSKLTSSQVKSVTTTFALAGMDLAAPSLMRDNSSLDPTFTSTMPLVVPGTSKGSVLAVHAVGVDTNGLDSNVIDMQIMLK